MEWSDDMIKQSPKPTGKLGRIVGEEMNVDHSELWEWGLSQISIGANTNILDVGCGGGGAIQLLNKLSANSKICGIDFSDEMVSLSREVTKDLIKDGLVEISNGSVSSIPYHDDMFDLVTAFETYYFWSDLTSDLRQIFRVLKPGGIFLMVNSTYRHEKYEERNAYLAKLIEFKYHTPEEFHSFLSEAGYSSIEIIEIPEKNWISIISNKSGMPP